MNEPTKRGSLFPANEKTVERVLGEACHDDGRSDFMWMRTGSGDLILGVFPCGEFYFDIEDEVAADYSAADAAGTLRPLEFIYPEGPLD